MMTLSLDKPVPFAVPDAHGCIFEIGHPNPGMNVVVQYPNMSAAELRAFSGPLLSYAYYESQSRIPIAYWLFRFGGGITLETTFNACFGLEKSEYLQRINAFLQNREDDMVANSLLFLFLDGRILKGNKFFGLHPDAVRMFQATLLKQLDIKFTREEFIITLKQMENALSMDELFSMGTVFVPDANA